MVSGFSYRNEWTLQRRTSLFPGLGSHCRCCIRLHYNHCCLLMKIAFEINFGYLWANILKHYRRQATIGRFFKGWARISNLIPIILQSSEEKIFDERIGWVYLHSQANQWFSFTSMPSIDQSMKPIMKLCRMTMLIIRFDSKVWFALWHHAV